MSNDNTRDAAEPSPASAGSVGEVLAKGIADIIRIAAEPDWIPVTERMPELRKVVLGHSDEWAIPFAVLEYFGGRDPWVDAEGFFAEPTHWMPLPAPPQTDK